jgi:chemotaxis protein methyltransferase CheR
MFPLDPVERHLFLEGIFLKYGYDFRQYSEASFDRRLKNILTKFEMNSLLEVLQKAISSPSFFREMIPLLTINTTEFFRDPQFFKALREKVFPVLKTYPTINIWLAGCSSGEEIISIAILLKEENLYNRSTIYATDINSEVLKKARDGIYEMSTVQNFIKNYVAAGGTKSSSEYYTAEYGLVRFDPSLRENVVFSEHNLVTDSVFAESHLIICRNVLIYFSRELQNRVFSLFEKSLVYRGFLGIGTKESLRLSGSFPLFEEIDINQHIYQMKSSTQVPSGDGRTL